MPEVTLLVLAAGLGQRYGGLKQLDPVGPSGETILDYSLHDAVLAGFNRVVFVIREEIEKMFWKGIARYWATRLPTEVVFQEIQTGLPPSFSPPRHRRKPWGTAHAVLVSHAAVTTPFAVINADDFYGPSAYRSILAWLRKSHPDSQEPAEYCFVGYRLARTLSEFGAVSRGVCALNEEGFLKTVVEMVHIEKQGRAIRARHPEGQWIRLQGDEIVSLNLWGFTPSVFPLLKERFVHFLHQSGQDGEAEFFLPAAVNDLIKTGRARVRYLPTEENWFGVTHPEDLFLARRRVREFISSGLYPPKIRG